MRCRSAVVSLALFLTGCHGSVPEGVALCGPSGSLRVGYVGAAEGQVLDVSQVISDSDQERMRTLMTVAGRCDVQFEPLLSPERARLRLQAGHWDLAFLPPGLTALAMQPGVDGQPVRSLTRPNASRSALLVSAGSPFRALQDLNERRLGLLPRGSLTGFYLPLYNLHGLRLKEVRYAISYSALLSLLRAGDVDAIAWDVGLPSPGEDVRVLAEDSHDIPSGAMVLSQALVNADHKSLLATLDSSAAEMPKELGYASSVLPSPQTYQTLKDIVSHVEGWTLPEEGRPYTVFGGMAEVP
mgnify:CR=1 FL=1